MAIIDCTEIKRPLIKDTGGKSVTQNPTIGENFGALGPHEEGERGAVLRRVARGKVPSGKKNRKESPKKPRAKSPDGGGKVKESMKDYLASRGTPDSRRELGGAKPTESLVLHRQKRPGREE